MNDRKYNYQFVLDDETVRRGDSSHAKILQQVRPNSAVLECGPGYGVMTRYLKETLDCRVYILELDSDCYAHAYRYAEGGACADLDQDDWMAVLEEASFDYILYADVLEHLRNPQAVLAKMKRFLKPTGCVLLSVPNVAHGDIIANLLCDQFTYTPLGLLDATHIHFFARKNLQEMIRVAGYYLAKETFMQVPMFATEQGRFIPEDRRSAVEQALITHSTSRIYQFVCCLSQTETETVSDIETNLGEIQSEARFYLDFGQGLSEKNRITSIPIILEGGRLRYELALPEGCIAVRYDPVELRMCILRNLSVQINGVDTAVCPINGLAVGTAVFFANKDPQFSIIPPAEGGELTVETQLDLLTNESFPAVYRLMLELNAQMEAERTAWAQSEAAYTAQLAALNAQMETERTAWAQSEAAYSAHIAQLEEALSISRTQLTSVRRAYIRAEDAVMKKTAQCAVIAAALEEQTRVSAMLNTQMIGMQNSRSWKLTKPLRAIKQLVKG